MIFYYDSNGENVDAKTVGAKTANIPPRTAATIDDPEFYRIDERVIDMTCPATGPATGISKLLVRKTDEEIDIIKANRLVRLLNKATVKLTLEG